jgi:phage terminase large subunit
MPGGSWPPDYAAEFSTRINRIQRLKSDAELRAGIAERYRDDPVAWILHWAVTYDPRKASTDEPPTMPFVLFDRQAELVEFLAACIDGQQSGLIEKARDMGATWVCCAFSVWLWLYRPGASIGWGSRKEQLVDKLGDPDSIFEKMRIVIRNLPRLMLPDRFDADGDMPYMKIVNRQTGATITGESGDNIGRGGRKLIYFKDESAHYERPEKIEAALADTTNVQIDISSVNGPGNVFHRRREGGKEWAPGQELATDRANVFVMDWRDHPAKDPEWYAARRAKADADGLLHVFAQEVDRNYTAAVEGTIIPGDWVASAIDAHLTLGFSDDGAWRAALDPADEGGDLHALAIAKGSILHSVEDWGEGDVGKATRRSVDRLRGRMVALQYDSIGVGAGVKSEANRLRDTVGDDDKPMLPVGITFQPWNAGSSPLRPDDHVVAGDDETPTNKDMFKNLKAQAWWQLRLRFERTHKAVTAGEVYDPADLISLPSDMAGLSSLRKELSQATRGVDSSLRLIVNKKPSGTKSPNKADAVVMAFWPTEAEIASLGFLNLVRDQNNVKTAAEVAAADQAKQRATIQCPHAPGSVEYERFMADAGA